MKMIIAASVLFLFNTKMLIAQPTVSMKDVFSGNVRIVDLTYTLNAKSPYWPGEDYQPFELKTIATLEEDGVLSKVLTLPEHLGTHIDAPNHFEADRPAVDEIPPGTCLRRES